MRWKSLACNTVARPGPQGLRYGWLPSVIHHDAPGEHWATVDPVKAGAISDPLDPPLQGLGAFDNASGFLAARPMSMLMSMDTDFDKAGGRIRRDGDGENSIKWSGVCFCTVLLWSVSLCECASGLFSARSPRLRCQDRRPWSIAEQSILASICKCLQASAPSFQLPTRPPCRPKKACR
ncbi:hypothetical protein M431DRAFT_557042 [Trichoderma harzianum CBS 226.95]|uniref:Uncharacterized protein n=1 Tax=Trichoderma harzianum CBS 226.95 TaxID=983964 RepID=A0A2T4A6K4_TRIHA|nr:hypothetical protein M431DRAFT_557042 [Trichoderma harzianum CBS 226.95]PTB52648.1 hypothetical protein M431DRAFT_557042 [Trichoderma harzianum CBS 226.95]